MKRTRPKIVVALIGAVVLVGAVAGGRHLLAGTSSSPTSSAASEARPGLSSPGSGVPMIPASTVVHAFPASTTGAGGSQPAARATSAAAPAEKSGSATALPAVPTFALTPQVVHTASVQLRVGRGKLDVVLRDIAAVAGADGGYVDSSSVSGGTAQRSPVAGAVVFRVLDSDFADAIAKVANLGEVEDQKISGKDVTIEVAQNTASIAVLQDEVTLLQKKLAEATDLGTFLQIQGELFPVERQLQQLQAAQAVLENSAALATVTVDLSAPGAPVVVAPPARPAADAATTAWRYLRHNSLAVLDGLAVAGGWALPVLVLLALVGLVALRVTRRRRQAVTAA
jgi:hypothetical protein